MALVFSDMDGTFLADDKSIPERNLEALDYLRSVGCRFVPCTGRVIKGIDPVVLAHPATTHAVCCNGAVVMARREDGWERILERPMEFEVVSRLYGDLSQFDLMFELFVNDTVYVSRAALRLLDELCPNVGMRRYIHASRTPVDGKILTCVQGKGAVDRVNIRVHERDRSNVEVILQDYPSIAVAVSDVNGFDITMAGINKGGAMKWLSSNLGEPLEGCMAFGDAGNDIEMLKEAGVGIAPSNANITALDIADETTVSNTEGGVGEYILSHGFFFER